MYVSHEKLIIVSYYSPSVLCASLEVISTSLLLNNKTLLY